jgi:geranylgeranyl diphosphate synthase type II
VSLEAYLASLRERVDRTLERLLPAPEGAAATVASAMRYAVLGGGKRLRPAVVLAACEACGGAAEAAAVPAAAIELIHTYSLIHDDLPAMDDDDLRRGRPTVHRAFGEAEAILAGDGLLTLAFEILASEPGSRHAAEAVAIVARRAGFRGMVGGQMADLEAERKTPDARGLEWIHRHKTGALFAASAEIGAIYADAPDDVRGALARYGEALGLAFQITDDLLDETATAVALGKTPGKDRRAGKATYPSLLGIEASRLEALRLVEVALAEIAPLGAAAERLAQLARLSVARSG